jgi:hypothetical protein
MKYIGIFLSAVLWLAIIALLTGCTTPKGQVQSFKTLPGDVKAPDRWTPPTELTDPPECPSWYQRPTCKSAPTTQSSSLPGRPAGSVSPRSR